MANKCGICGADINLMQTQKLHRAALFSVLPAPEKRRRHTTTRRKRKMLTKKREARPDLSSLLRTDRAALFCYNGYTAESIPEWNIFDEYTRKE